MFTSCAGGSLNKQSKFGKPMTILEDTYKYIYMGSYVYYMYVIYNTYIYYNKTPLVHDIVV